MQYQSPWLRPEGVAEYLGVSVNKVRAMIRSGRLKSHRDPDSKQGILVNVAEVDEMVYGWPSASSSPQPLDS